MNRGFTLIETLVYLALFALLLGSAVICTWSLLIVAATGSTYAHLAEESDFIAARIASEALRSHLESPAPGEETAAAAFLDGTSFSRSGTNLIESAGSERVLNTDDVAVEGISFQGTPGEGLRIVLTLSSHTRDGGKVTRTATTTIYRK